MRGVADQRQPFPDERGGATKIAERKTARGLCSSALISPRCSPNRCFELAVKFLARSRATNGAPPRRASSVHTSDERCPVSGRIAKRTRGQKNVPRRGRDDRATLADRGPRWPDGRNPSHGLTMACAFPRSFRARPPSARPPGRARRDKRCRRPASRRCPGLRESKLATSGGVKLDAFGLGHARPAHRSGMAVFDHVPANGFARLDMPPRKSGTPDGSRPSSLESVTTMSRIGCACPAT